MTRAAMYAGYSSEGQKESSIEDQFRNCQRWAEGEGLEIVPQYSDRTISGSTAAAPDIRDADGCRGSSAQASRDKGRPDFRFVREAVTSLVAFRLIKEWEV